MAWTGACPLRVYYQVAAHRECTDATRNSITGPWLAFASLRLELFDIDFDLRKKHVYKVQVLQFSVI